MDRRKTVERELFDQIVTNIKDAHAATNALFDEKITNVSNTLSRIEETFGSRMTMIEADHKKVERKVYLIMGAFALAEILLAWWPHR